MGKVTTTITVTNISDSLRAEEGELETDSIRTVTLDRVLVDTGATLLCLPSSVIEQLGLRVQREVAVSTATGIQSARIFRGVHLTILGRDGIFDCLELPGGQDALLGVIPLETMGLEPDLQNRCLRALPMSPEQTYLSIL
ncbi:retroviral-like aspartic protease [Pseudanabaenaceae cyanobacterium LEGE 13415]|nr:retroviral-like aspartic protease [Pseudanabaenaceae cyanobacterium LEGE 13415]